MGSRPPHGVPVSSVVCQGLCLGAAALRPHRGSPRSWFSQTCLQPWPEDPVPRAFRPSSLSSVAEGATGVLLKRPEMEGACAHVCTCVRAHECVHSSVHPCASYRIPLRGVTSSNRSSPASRESGHPSFSRKGGRVCCFSQSCHLGQCPQDWNAGILSTRTAALLICGRKNSGKQRSRAQPSGTP